MDRLYLIEYTKLVDCGYNHSDSHPQSSTANAEERHKSMRDLGIFNSRLGLTVYRFILFGVSAPKGLPLGTHAVVIPSFTASICYGRRLMKQLPV